MKIDPVTKRAKFTSDSITSDFAALNLSHQKFGRNIHVFKTDSPTNRKPANNDDLPDDFYNLKPEDYYRLLSKSKGEDRSVLKTRKIREAEAAARRSKFTRSTIRVRFPDNYTLEAEFHPSEKIGTLIDLLKKTLSYPQFPFYVYTTPPKMQLKDMSHDFYSAGFVPGAIVYFAYSGKAPAGAFLSDEVMKMAGEPMKPTPLILELMEIEAAARPVAQERKPASKMTAKPKWLRM